MPLPTPVISDGLLPIDVSALPASAEALAKTLEAGNTGVPSLDQEKIDGPDPAFERAVLLLLAPMIGAQPRFSAVTYQAIALLPGVVSLGTVSTHSGKTGQGFAAGKGANAVAIVVSRTGTLLEVRNFRSGAWNGLWAELVATSFSATNLAAVANIGNPPLVSQLSFTTDWLDPNGPPSAVDPATIPTFRQIQYL